MLFFMVIFLDLSAQNNKNRIGLVRDLETLEPIHSAYIKTTASGASTDTNGIFHIDTDLSDSLVISHIGYETLSISLKEHSEDTLLIFLVPNTTILNEVKIYGLPSEEKFKYHILHTKVKTPIETLNAVKNFELIRNIYLSGYWPALDSEDNHQNYVSAPQGANLLGFFEAIKNIGRKQYPLQNLKMNQSSATADSVWIQFYRYKAPFNWVE